MRQVRACTTSGRIPQRALLWDSSGVGNSILLLVRGVFSILRFFLSAYYELYFWVLHQGCPIFPENVHPDHIGEESSRIQDICASRLGIFLRDGGET